MNLILSRDLRLVGLERDSITGSPIAYEHDSIASSLMGTERNSIGHVYDSLPGPVVSHDLIQ